MPRQRRKKRSRAFVIVIVGIIALVGGIVFLLQVGNPCNGFPYPTTRGQGLAEHYHIQLLLVINGHTVNLPQDIGDGDTGECLQPLHNHATSPNTNVIHIEAPVVQNYTLGDFFRVWAATPNIGGPKPVVFNPNQIFNNTVTNGYELRMYVNGQRSSDFGNLVLGSKMTVVLVYGPSGITPWSTYQNLSGEAWPYPNY